MRYLGYIRTYCLRGVVGRPDRLCIPVGRVIAK